MNNADNELKAPTTRQTADALYVMQKPNGLIKVGRSKAPRRRAQELRCQGGEHVHIVAVWKGRADEERRLHGLLAAHRNYGEWFDHHSSVYDILTKEIPEPLKWLVPRPSRRVWRGGEMVVPHSDWTYYDWKEQASAGMACPLMADLHSYAHGHLGSQYNRRKYTVCGVRTTLELPPMEGPTGWIVAAKPKTDNLWLVE